MSLKIACLPPAHLYAEKACASVLFIHFDSPGGISAGYVHLELFSNGHDQKHNLKDEWLKRELQAMARHRAPCTSCCLDTVSHVPWTLLDEQGLSPVGQSLLLRPLANHLSRASCLYSWSGVGMGKEGLCQHEWDVVSVLRELWLVRETDTHTKIQDKA